ncbi:MAG: glycerate kinase [Verrucomicrobiota bacterium]
MRILIAPDKFKGTLTAPEAAAAIARGWRRVRPGDSLDLLPTSDGGDGFGEVVGQLLGAKVQTVATCDAAHRPIRARWWLEPKSKTAIIESAGVIGLALLPPGKFHPFDLDTFGLGAVFQAAAQKGARRCLVGIGGSATNDGGFGVARALGWKFHAADGSMIERWTDLHRLAGVKAPARRRLFKELIIAVDVQNPLLGRRGASRVYGPQKGLQPDDLPLAERNLRRLAKVCEARSRRPSATTPGTGAAGGLGFGLGQFLGGKLRPGFELFARQARLDARLRAADLVITGEGCLDASTLMGKGVGEIARRCRRLGIPCVGLAGKMADDRRLHRRFTDIFALTEITSEQNAHAQPAQWLERLAEKAGRRLAAGQI